MTTNTELAHYIEQGMKLAGVEESTEHWLHRDEAGYYHVCALGFALIGQHGDVETAYNEYEREDRATGAFPLIFLAKLLDISFDTACAIDAAHCQGISSEQIITDLHTGMYA